jgi:hypothetical protein
LDSRLWGVIEVWNFGSCLTGTPCVVDRPPTHFFVKKKFSSIGGAAPATQKVPSVFCHARDFLCGVGLGATLEISSPVCAGIPVRRRKYPAGRRELFSLRKKRTAGIRLPAWQWFGSLYKLNPTPFPPLKKPLKRWESKGGQAPLAKRETESRGLALRTRQRRSAVRGRPASVPVLPAPRPAGAAGESDAPKPRGKRLSR